MPGFQTITLPISAGAAQAYGSAKKTAKIKEIFFFIFGIFNFFLKIRQKKFNSSDKQKNLI